MQLFTSQDNSWWTGAVWIIVMFLSAVWTLILTAPIHCRSDEMLHFSKSIKPIYILYGLRASTFSFLGKLACFCLQISKCHTCEDRRLQSIWRPRPVFCRWSKAAMTAPWVYKPVARSVIATPGLTGSPSLKQKSVFNVRNKWEGYMFLPQFVDAINYKQIRSLPSPQDQWCASYQTPQTQWSHTQACVTRGPSVHILNKLTHIVIDYMCGQLSDENVLPAHSSV